jgi:hypothetical protein
VSCSSWTGYSPYKIHINFSFACQTNTILLLSIGMVHEMSPSEASISSPATQAQGSGTARRSHCKYVRHSNRNSSTTGRKHEQQRWWLGRDLMGSGTCIYRTYMRRSSTAYLNPSKHKTPTSNPRGFEKPTPDHDGHTFLKAALFT